MASDVAQAASLCSWYITVRVCTQTGSPCYAPPFTEGLLSLAFHAGTDLIIVIQLCADKQGLKKDGYGVFCVEEV